MYRSPVRRRARFLGVALAALFPLVAAACSGSSEPSSASTAPGASETTSAVSGEPSSSASSAPGTSEAAPVVGEELTFGVLAGPSTLNPATGDPAYSAIYQWAYDPLVILQPDGSFAPGLAEKFGYVGEGNTTYELTLRDGVKFSDGTPLDAEAVKTYLEYARTQTIGSVGPMLVNVKSIEVTAPMTVRLNLTKSDPSLTFAFAQAFGAGDIASPAAVADPASLDTGTAGAGPYMLDGAQTVAGDHYTFVQNPNFWDPARQHWKKVTVRVIPNPSSMLQAIQAGQIDVALGEPTTLQAAQAAGLTVAAPPQALAGVNLMDRAGTISKPLGDVRVRQALNFAVDREAIAKALYGDTDRVLTQYALEGQVAYDESLNDTYSYAPEQARELLKEAGYADGFSFSVVSTPLFGGDTLMQAIAGQLGKIGVKMEIKSFPTAVDYIVAMLSGDYPAAAIGYGLATMSSLYSGFVNPIGTFNPFHYSDAELDSLYEQYNAASGEAGDDLARQINKRLVDQAWTLPVVGSPLPYYSVAEVTGVDATSGNAGVPLFTEIRPAG